MQKSQQSLHEAMVTTPEELAACCAALAPCPVIGIDTEFVGEDTYHPRLCLVQVAIPGHLYLIDPLTTGPLDGFWPLIIDPKRTVIVHAGREEVRLCHLWGGAAPGRLFDLQLAAGLIGLPYPMGHGALVSTLLRVQLSKGETLTEWRDRPLTREQIRYAFDDVRYLLALWQKLQARLAELGRESWAEEEFARLTSAALATPETTEKFRKLRGVASLDRRKLAVVRELYSWREQRAAETNRPPRTILRDDLLVEIARRQPMRERDLQVVRGLSRRELSHILEVVTRASNLPPELCPSTMEREQDPPQMALITNILQAVLADWCVRHHLAPNLAASTNDLRLLIRARLNGQQPTDESALTRGWRAAQVLPQLLEVLDGKRTLRIANVGSVTPLHLEPQSDADSSPS